MRSASSPLAEFVNSGLSSVRNSCPEKASRPFDVFADSGVCAEGAGLFLIEEKSTRSGAGRDDPGGNRWLRFVPRSRQKRAWKRMVRLHSRGS